jgi:hypothetical protein
MTFDENGYPDDDTLKQIETFDLGVKFENLHEYLKLIWENWEYANASWTYDKNTGCLQISTCGWSGNEEIIAAMKQNYLFWGIFWYQSKRGGHYWFQVYQFDRNGHREPVKLDFLEGKK